MLKRSRALHTFITALALIACALFLPAKAAAQTANANDVVIVLPFENSSNRPEYNWVGESFSDSLSELLNVPGITVISSNERELAYQRVRLPLTTLPSRATAIKLAREAKATMLVLGEYKVIQGQGTNAVALQGTARVIRINEGRRVGESFDGGWVPRVYDFGDALTSLQKMQGILAYQILSQRDRALAFTRNEFISRATKVPPLAFEAYVKGVQTSENDEKRAIYLKNALRIYADSSGGAVYPQAAFELGHFYLKKNDWRGAAEYFSRLQKKDPHYTESAFYASLAFWRLGDLNRALSTLMPLTSSDLPLTGVYNNAGAIAVQAARGEKKPEERNRLLAQALSFLSRAADSSPDDPTVRFNYAYALFLSGKYAEAADQLRPVITADPRDGQAYFLYAKSLERTGRADQAAAADDQARRYLQVYAKWQTDWQKSQTTLDVPLRLRQAFNRSDYFEAVRASTAAANADPSGSTQDLLAKARELYAAGQDEEALPELRRVLMVEPMNAEAYLLIGRIDQRRGDPEAAISVLKTAIFWDAKLIDAHILLGRIFLERGDRAMAMTYARNAIQIDPNNQEAIALQRQVETGGK